MRFVLAIVSFVLAAAMMGYGVAQRTILAEPDEVSHSVTVASDAAVTMIDGATLNAFDGSQTLALTGKGEIFAAYGRTADVVAWIGDNEYNAVTFDSETGELTSKLVRGTETEIPDPQGSDLWLDDYVKEGNLRLTVKVPDDISFIIASDGIEPAPAKISLTWPLDNSTPWSGPLIVGGGVVLLLGLALLFWAISHERRANGPRRKQPKMPKVPKQPRYKPSRKAIEKPVASDRVARRGMIAIPTVVIAALVLSGCSAEFWPRQEAAATPTPTATDAQADAGLDAPAATVRQVERIIAQVSQVATDADAARDAELLKTRFDGPALELRLADYTIRGNDPTIATTIPAILDGPVSVMLPQQTELWPRTVFAVIQDDEDETIPPVALFLVQDDPRAAYKVHYAITLEASTVLPKVAPASLGASRLLEETPVLRLPPGEVALAYADILEKDVESESYLDFEAEGDSMRVAVGLAAKQAQAAGLPATASIAFGHALGLGQAIALATNDSGALVAVNLNETTTVAPVEAGAAVNPSGSVKALSGVSVSTKGVVATYGDQLLFYVPSAESKSKIILLGYSQGLITASELG